MFEIKGKYTTAQVYATVCDNDTISQITNMCNQIWTEGSHIAIMPDTHYGVGCTIGTTMTINDKLCPSAVGTDIGCGMLCVELPHGNEITDYLKEIDDFINENICAGAIIRDIPLKNDKIESEITNMKCYKELKGKATFMKALGTLGGSNHFIEISFSDLTDKYFLVIHSGSRALGNSVGSYYVGLAEKRCNEDVLNKQYNEWLKEIKKKINPKDIQKERAKYLANQPERLMDKHLCYLEGEDFNNYLHDMDVCNRYAKLSREIIATEIIEFIYSLFGKKAPSLNDIYHFHTIHNYVDIKNKILRKGAISCQEDELVIIPVNMRDGSLICIGNGNKDYNYSGPHGAGRILSRKEAKNTVSLEEYKKAMSGVYTTSVCENTLDESPMAYKSLEDIVADITDTATIVDLLIPVYNFKSSSTFMEDIKQRTKKEED